MAGEKFIHKFDLGDGNAAFILSPSSERPVKSIAKITPQSWEGKASGQTMSAIKMLSGMSFSKEKNEPASAVQASVAEHVRYLASTMGEE